LPGADQIFERIAVALKGVGVAGPDTRVVAIADLRCACFGVVLRQESGDGLGRSEGRIAVIEVAIGERQIHRLVKRVQVTRRVVAHRPQIEVFEDVEGLQHRRTLRPGVELVDVDTAVTDMPRFFDFDAPIGEIVARDEATLCLHRRREFGGDVAAIKTIVGRHDRLLARRAAFECAGLGLDEFAQRRREFGLTKDFAGLRSFAVVVGAAVRQHDASAVGPLLEFAFVSLDERRRLRFHRIAVGEFDGWREHFAERETAVLGEHHQNAAGRARGHGGQWSEFRRIFHALGFEELRRRPRGCNAEGVDRDHTTLFRMPDERLRFTTPMQHVPHRRCGGDHCAGGIHRVATALEDPRACRGA